MSNVEKLEAWNTYFNLMTMNGSAAVYRTARDLGIFDAVGPNGSSAQAIAMRCNLQEKPVQLLLDGLCAMGTLTNDGNHYCMTPVMRFLTGNYSNLGDDYWDYLPQLLKTGVPLAKMDSIQQSEKQYQHQIAALDWMMKPAAETAAMMLGIGESRRALNILDVGAGSAVWSLIMAQKDTGIRVTALDWPKILKFAAVTAKNLGLYEKFTALPGNYHEVELAEGIYDLAIVANVTHIETPEGNLALFRKLHRALKRTGEIAIFDVMPGQEKGQPARALYALGLALRTEQGQVYTCDELNEFLQQSGFAKAIFSPIRSPPYIMGMIVARKELSP